MNPLPSAVEHALIEAGCSATEILLIQHMLGGDPTTLRLLAQRTGKSTGVLDQAMKKLMKKGIVVRETINNNPKFVLKSLQNIVQWLHDETLHRREQLLRKYQTFEAFVATMENEKTRPEMKYFDGDDGLEQAYFSLIEEGKHWRQYLTVAGKEQDDPLWQMRVRLFRARKEAGVFCRVITHDTETGRAFQARDPFEYRETMLVSKESCPIPCEKIIVGNVVACFQYAQKRACFVRFQEQVSWETSTFDLFWETSKADMSSSASPFKMLARATMTESAALQLFCRKFFSKKRNLLAIGLCCLAVMMAAFGIQQWQRIEQEQYVQQELLKMVSDGAKIFDIRDLNEIHTTVDMEKSEYKKIIAILQQIRREALTTVDYIYLMRPTETKGVYTFIAEGDAIDPTTPFDFNEDGRIDAADEYVLPGLKYVALPEDPLSLGVPQKPITADQIIEDQWGPIISAYAPIFGPTNEVVAILGVDVLQNKRTY